jgi:hypothetical protein
MAIAVDLPPPDGPTSATFWPARTRNEIERKTGTSARVG